MTDRQSKAKAAIGAVFKANNITAPPTRAAYTALNIAAYPIMRVRRIFGSWDRAMKNLVLHTKTKINRGPVVAIPLVDQSVVTAEALNYQFNEGSFTDADTDTLTYTVVSKPAWITFTAGTRTFTGTAPAIGPVNVYPVTIRATDTSGIFAEDTFNVTVTET
jgi:hypothetical protein